MSSTRQVTVATDAGLRSAELVVAADARPHHLAAALGLRSSTLLADGRSLSPDRPLAEQVPPGAHLHAGETTAPAERPALHLVTAGGVCAGHRLPLVPGRTATVGRSPDADLRIPCPTVSPRHATVTWSGDGPTLVDLGSTNGLRVRGTGGPSAQALLLPGAAVRLGVHTLRAEAGDADDRMTLPPADPSDGRHPVDRPLLDPLPPEPAPVPVPEPPTRIGGRTPFSWAVFLLPLVGGCAFALWLSPAMAVFALLSPLMVLASWFEQRRRQRAGHRADQRHRRRQLSDLARAVTAQRDQVAARLIVTHPDPAEVQRRARTPTRALWSRRPDHPAWLHLRLGWGSRRWTPRLDLRGGGEPAPEVQALLAPLANLEEVPVTLPAGDAAVVGLTGPARVTRAAARALLVDAATHHGPADLAMAVDAPDPAPWAWTRWLPHATNPDGAGADGHLLVVADGARGLRPGTAARQWLDGRPGRATVLVVAEDPADLPDRCDLVVEADAVGRATVRAGDEPAPTASLVLDGLPVAVAEATARALARLRDPEQADHRDLPTQVRFADLDRSTGGPTPAAGPGRQADPPTTVADRWATSRRTGLPVALGVSAGGTFSVDLVADGPHALVGGTTGSGKSELLRSLVAGLAADHPPDHVTFVLVDYKGGSAFDACADLPHTVGLITDLDGALGDRAIRSLEAEIRRRERHLRGAGASDIGDLGEGAPALPRLVVVVDEFATLAREWPGVLDALVDVARRGRSLGVHLVLATQRPTGVVNDQIRTNTDLRIALRMLERADAADVVGDDRPTRLPATVPGRAVVRTPGGTHEVQVACGSQGADLRPVIVHWLDDQSPLPATDRDGPSELEVLVAEVAAAWEERLARRPGVATARHRPWVAPLPAEVHLTDEPADAGPGAAGPERWVVGVTDEPAEQRRGVLAWSPAAGPFLCVGMPGSGTTTALRTLVERGARRRAPADLHAYVVGSPAAWAGVADLPHVGAVVDPDDAPRLDALWEVVRAAAGRPSDGPLTLLVVDGLRPVLDAVDRSGGIVAVDQVLSLLSRRRAALAVAASVDRAAVLPGPLAAVTDQKLCLRLPDAYDYTALGLPPMDPHRLPPGRGYDVATGLEVQVALASPGDRRAWPPPPDGAGPDPLDVLPARVALTDLRGDPDPAGPVAAGDREPDLVLPLGLLDRPRREVALALSPGEHLLVAGPDRSGRSTALLVLATGAPAGRVVVTGAPRSPLRIHPTTSPHWCPWPLPGRDLDPSAPTLLVVDDADLCDDEDGTLGHLLDGSPHLHVAAAVHHDRIRTRYGHWSGPLAQSRLGLALQPAPADGSLWATTLPSRPATGWPPGRGYLLDHGGPQLVQVADPGPRP